MIPSTRVRDIKSNGLGQGAAFGISVHDSAHIMTILRDTIYSDKILAILREYSSNAWDAHRVAGKQNVPIKIVLPTALNPSLVIRDFGPGLSQDDVFQVYTQYGASTKRGSNDAVGMLGIGSKSGFTYSDSFTITSFHDGMKRIYVALIDDSQKGIIKLMHEESSEETGIEIEIAARQHDIEEFDQKAKELFTFFEPQPDINTTLPTLPDYKKLTNGLLWLPDSSKVWAPIAHNWQAVMGCVPYKIDLKQIPEAAHYLYSLAGILYFNIGEIEISASRESLKYSDSTKGILRTKLEQLVEEYVKTTLEEIEKDNVSSWQKRLKGQVLNHINFPIPKIFEKYTEPTIYLKTGMELCSLHNNRLNYSVSHITVCESGRFLFRDDARPLPGFNLTHSDYIIVPAKKATWDEIEAELEVFCKTFGIDGIPIGKLSALPWTAPVKSIPKKTVNKKHFKKSFVFMGSNNDYFHSPYSKYWDAVTRVPGKEDVYVIIKDFQSRDYNFFELYHSDQALMHAFDIGSSHPPIYAYKNTKANPVTPDSLTGTHYPDWRKQFIQKILTKDVKGIIENWYWASMVQESPYYSQTINSKSFKKAIKALGKNHEIAKLLEKSLEAKEFFVSKDELSRNLHNLESDKEFLPGSKDIVDKVKAITTKYPLLTVGGGLEAFLLSTTADRWVDYIKLIDSTGEKK